MWYSPCHAQSNDSSLICCWVGLGFGFLVFSYPGYPITRQRFNRPDTNTRTHAHTHPNTHTGEVGFPEMAASLHMCRYASAFCTRRRLTSTDGGFPAFRLAKCTPRGGVGGEGVGGGGRGHEVRSVLGPTLRLLPATKSTRTQSAPPLNSWLAFIDWRKIFKVTQERVDSLSRSTEISSARDTLVALCDVT